MLELKINFKNTPAKKRSAILLRFAKPAEIKISAKAKNGSTLDAAPTNKETAIGKPLAKNRAAEQSNAQPSWARAILNAARNRFRCGIV